MGAFLNGDRRHLRYLSGNQIRGLTWECSPPPFPFDSKINIVGCIWSKRDER